MQDTVNNTPTPVFFRWLNRVIQFGNACASILWPLLCFSCYPSFAVILGIYLLIAAIWVADVFKMVSFIHKHRKVATVATWCHLALDIAAIMCLVLEMLWILFMPSLRSWTFVVLILMFTLTVKAAAHFHRLTIARMCYQNLLDRSARWYITHSIVRAAMPMTLLLITLPTVFLVESFEDHTPILAGTVLSRHSECLRTLGVPSVVASTSETESESESENTCSHVLEDMITFFGTQLYSLKVWDRVLVDNSSSAPWSQPHYRQIVVKGITIILNSNLQIISMFTWLLVSQILVAASICLLLWTVERFLLRSAFFPPAKMEVGRHNGEHKSATSSSSKPETMMTTATSPVGPTASENKCSQEQAATEAAEVAETEGLQEFGQRTKVQESGSACVSRSKEPLGGDTVDTVDTVMDGQRTQDQEFGSASVSRSKKTLGGDTVDTVDTVMGVAHKMKSSRRFFFNAMSHELRTPIATMVTNLELLEPSITSLDQLEYFANIQKAGDDVLKKINDMLAYATMMDGLVVVNKVARPFVSFTRALVEECQVTYKRMIGFMIEAHFAEFLRFDCRLVSSVIRYILDNSVRYAQSGDRISVRLFKPSAEELSALGRLLASQPNDVTSIFHPLSSMGMVAESRNQRSKSGEFARNVSMGSSTSHLSTLSHLSRAPNETMVALEVIDSGPGIESSLLPEVFKPFRDFNHGSTRSTTGCGFGLPLCRLMARTMGGEIMATSPWPPGAQGGTKVLVILPMEPVDEEPPGCTVTHDDLGPSSFPASFLQQPSSVSMTSRPVSQAMPVPKDKFTSANTSIGLPPNCRPSASSSAGPTPERYGSRKVLVAEDTPALQKMISVQLLRLGYEAIICDNGSVLLEHLKQQWFPLIFMDLHMPVLGGLDTTVQIRSLEAGGFFGDKPQIQIVAVTADAVPETKDRCFECGMNDFLLKPVRQKALSETLNRFYPECL